MDESIEVTYWQTHGWKVTIQADKVMEFDDAVSENTVDELFEEEIKNTAKAVHYEGEVVQVEL